MSLNRDIFDVLNIPIRVPLLTLLTHTVREFIRELLKRFVPGKWIDRVISEGDATFDAKLGAAEAKKANAELKAIAADVKKTMQTGFKEVRNDIKAVVAAAA